MSTPPIAPGIRSTTCIIRHTFYLRVDCLKTGIISGPNAHIEYGTTFIMLRVVPFPRLPFQILLDWFCAFQLHSIAYCRPTQIKVRDCDRYHAVD